MNYNISESDQALVNTYSSTNLFSRHPFNLFARHYGLKAIIFAAIFILSVFTPVQINASNLESSEIDILSFISDSDLQSLAYDPYWLKLIHYKPDSLSSGYNSYVDDPRFFNHPKGKTHPELELIGTIKSFLEKPESRCRFIARYQWLIQKLPKAHKLSESTALNCPEHDKWKQAINGDSAVLVYASSQLNSPSSMYGHTLIRIDPKDVDQGSKYLSYALSFGASVNEEDNDFLYALRGLVGGYPGLYVEKTYFEKLKEYSRIENRDLWEYKLNFNQAELDRMISHIWELRGINFDYYFFDENCAFRLLELFEIARPELNLLQDFPVFAIPLDTAKSVVNHALVSGVSYHPSELTKLKTLLSSLTDHQVGIVEQVGSHYLNIDHPPFDKLSKQEQAKTIDATYRYMRYQDSSANRDKKRSQIKLDLLQRTSRETKSRIPAITQPDRPDLGHDTSLIAISQGMILNGESGHRETSDQAVTDLQLRFSYHDLLDNHYGYDHGSSLNMGNLVFSNRFNRQLKLERFDFIEITSLSPRDILFKPYTWQANLGLERVQINNADVLTAQGSAGIGWSYQSLGGITFSLLNAKLAASEEFSSTFDVTPSIRIGHLTQFSNGKALLTFDQGHSLELGNQTEISYSQQIELSRQSAIRLDGNYALLRNFEFGEFNVSYRVYF